MRMKVKKCELYFSSIKNPIIISGTEELEYEQLLQCFQSGGGVVSISTKNTCLLCKTDDLTAIKLDLVQTQKKKVDQNPKEDQDEEVIRG